MPKTTPRTKKAKKAAMETIMREFKENKLHSGSKTGPKVKSRAQAIAIGLKQSGQSRDTAKDGRRSKISKQPSSTSAKRKKRLANVKF